MPLSNLERQARVDALWRVVDEVTLLWNLWSGLFGSSEARARTEHGAADDFFATLDWVLGDRLILAIASLRDRRSTLSLDELARDLGKERAARDFEGELSNLSNLCHPLKAHRDKRLAHLNRDVALEGGTALPSISVDRVATVVARLNDILAGLEDAVDPRCAHSRSRPIQDKGGHKQILPVLKDAERWKSLHEWLHSRGYQRTDSDLSLSEVVQTFQSFLESEPRPSWMQ